MNKKILSQEELENYYAGKGCQCNAPSSTYCCCNIDWTPREIYELRLKVEKLREPIKILLNREYSKLNCSGRPTRAETDIDYFEQLLKETEI